MTPGKEKLKIAFKLILGVGLLVYVVRSKMIDFETLHSVLSNPVNLLLSVLFLGFSALCCATRWFFLVRAQGLSLSLKELFELTMIGNFFNTFMPGSVGGDLIKAWYVAGQEPNRKTKAVFTVLLDRVIGLSVIVGYAALTLVFYTQWLNAHPELKVVAYTLWGFTTACFLGTFLFFSSATQWEPVKQMLDLLRKLPKLGTLVDSTLLYRQHRWVVVWAILLSAASIFGTTLLYSLQGNNLGIQIDLAHYFFVVPVGLTISAIPLLPGGIGVGQVAFFTLFKWTGMPNPEQGATLCTLLQVYTILFNCLGAVFYLKFKRKPRESGSLDNSLAISANRANLL
jgi:glycosyltransferase 2 family protein